MTQPPDSREAYELATRRYYQDAAVAAAYHAQFATGFSPRNISHQLVAQAEQRAIDRLLGPLRTRLRRAADIPCGTGKLVPILAGIPTVGGDVSRHMMTIARAGAQAASAPWEFAQLDVTALPFGSGTFDLVVCLRLLHRVPREIKIAALKELARVTRRFLIVSYGVTSPWHALRQALRRIVSRGSSIPHPIARDSANAMFAELGLTVSSRVRPLPVLSAEEITLLVRSD